MTWQQHWLLRCWEFWLAARCLAGMLHSAPTATTGTVLMQWIEEEIPAEEQSAASDTITPEPATSAPASQGAQTDDEPPGSISAEKKSEDTLESEDTTESSTDVRFCCPRHHTLTMTISLVCRQSHACPGTPVHVSSLPLLVP
jgi:hypothetical protein